MTTKNPVTRRALVQRVNRKLKLDDRVLRRALGARACQSLGDWYLLDTHRNTIVDTHVDVVRMATELGCMGAWEELADQPDAVTS